MLRLLVACCALELTLDTWDKAIEGKSVFVKFFANWCPNCKRMKRDWDKLMLAYENSPTALVAEVECTGKGHSLCEKQGVTKYPTIKYGDPARFELYQGGRSFKELRDFAHDILHLTCGPEHPDLCDTHTRGHISYLKSLSKVHLDEHIEKMHHGKRNAHQKFDGVTKVLTKKHHEIMEDSSLSTEEKEARIKTLHKHWDDELHEKHTKLEDIKHRLDLMHEIGGYNPPVHDDNHPDPKTTKEAGKHGRWKHHHPFDEDATPLKIRYQEIMDSSMSLEEKEAHIIELQKAYADLVHDKEGRSGPKPSDMGHPKEKPKEAKHRHEL